MHPKQLNAKQNKLNAKQNKLNAPKQTNLYGGVKQMKKKKKNETNDVSQTCGNPTPPYQKKKKMQRNVRMPTNDRKVG